MATHERIAFRPDIIVGVDGSPGSRDALRWAVEFAQRSGDRLRVLCAWHYVPEPTSSILTPMSVAPGDEERWARRTVEDAVAPFRGGSVEIVTEAVEGSAWRQLVGASEGARLLVVGRRGHGPVAGAILGSVSHHCVAYAGCPVVVVPTTPPAHSLASPQA